MASETSDSEDQAEESHEPRECMPCRGTGHVISNLGGSASTVSCPWCEGSGVRLQGVDAQAAWPANEVQAEPAGPPPDQAA